MAHRLLRDLEADGWERSDFPIICESCLGDNPYVRMTKANFDKECKICTRPFTVFRWRPGRDARYKKTEICQTCSKLKNVCQVCLLDLEFGLPVQVRDTAMGISSDTIPKSDVNREYFAEQQDNLAHSGADFESLYGKSKPNDLILQLQRTTPYYRRNRAHICSFYVRGECTRGAECPYRHEMPILGELSQQNIRDRYYGVNDPVANKLFRKAGEMALLTPPEDTSITTLYIGGLDQRISEDDLKSNFQSHGEVQSIRLVPNRACAFITYTTRQGAEKAAENCANKLVIKGLRLKLMWGRPQTQKLDEDGKGGDDADGEGRGSVLSSAGPGILGSGAAASASASTAGTGSHTGLSTAGTIPSLTHGGLLPRSVMPIQQQPQPQQQAAQQVQQPPLPPPVNYFNIPPPPPPLGLPGSDRSYYPSMDPQRMGAVTPNSNVPSSSAEGPLSAPPSIGAMYRPEQQQQHQFSGHYYQFAPPPVSLAASQQQQQQQEQQQQMQGFTPPGGQQQQQQQQFQPQQLPPQQMALGGGGGGYSLQPNQGMMSGPGAMMGPPSLAPPGAHFQQGGNQQLYQRMY